MINREFHRRTREAIRPPRPRALDRPHLAQYPWLPAAALAAAVINNFAASYIQLLIGRGFRLAERARLTTRSLGLLAPTVFLSAATQGLSGLGRNASFEFMAQRVERDGRDELYASLLGKSQTFHNRQRIGDIMARATNDVRTLNVMFSPGLMLITDSLVGLLAPVVPIYRLNPQLLLVPFLFIILLVITIRGYSRRLARSARAAATLRRHERRTGQKPSAASRSSRATRRRRRKGDSSSPTPPFTATTPCRRAKFRRVICPCWSSACAGGWLFSTPCCCGTAGN